MDLDIKDLVWKLALKDTEGRIIAGIDQFDDVHLYADPEEILAYVSQVEEMDPVVMALKIGVKIGEERRKTDGS